MALERLRAQEQAIADALIRVAFRHQCKDLALAGRELCQRTGVPAMADEARHDCRVDDAFALADPPKRVREGPNLRNPVLEQVARALRQLLDEATSRTATRGSATALTVAVSKHSTTRRRKVVTDAVNALLAL
jgi:hypothetical protein